METAKDRLRLLLGDERLRQLDESCVMVLGLGGVGSSCAEALARGGVGSLVLVDRDVVAPSNINRQALAFHSTLGRPKAEVMAQMVSDINPECKVCALQAFIDKDQVAEQLGALPRPSYVVDAIDTVSQKLAIAAWCQEQGIPEVSAMGGANKLDPTRLRFAPIEKTVVDPLARIVRKECRKRGIDRLQVLWSDETPIVPDHHLAIQALAEGGSTRRAIPGSSAFVPAAGGLLIASRVIRNLIGR